MTAPAIPFVDIRAGGPPHHAQQSAGKARALRDACLTFFPRPVLPVLPFLDWAARRWLIRSRSPYVAEIARIADVLGFSGVWLLNASYQWACTSLAREEDGLPWLARTLDWPFRGLGRHAEVARPVIFTLVGCAAHESCVIERTETGFQTRESETSAANDWVPERPGWEGRIGTRRFLISSFTEAAGFSRARRQTLAGYGGSLAEPGFGWVQPPVLNPYTRLAVVLCPARGILRAIGYDVTGAELPEPVTQACEIAFAPSLQPV